jgi:2-succinyl-6-hydroxy-2,4-cyclohexadiene-1-carboxylate synthase
VEGAVNAAAASLHRRVDGPGAAGGSDPPTVVLVHGFTQTSAVWEPVASVMREMARVVRVDLPGHGGSAALRLPFERAAAALGDAGGRATYVGYSLGGRLCLRLALDRPDLVASLVLVGASPGIADDGDRAARRAADHALADTIERDGTAAFLARWLAQPLFASLPADAPGAAERLDNPPDGLAASLRLLGTGEQEPLWDRLPSLRVPTRLVVGAQDAKFTALAHEMAARIGPSARVEVVPDSGHAVPLERPAAIAALVRDLLERTPG